MAQENEKNYSETIESKQDIGTVKIADDVVAMIASYAAMEVEGVAGMAGNSAQNWLSKAGVKQNLRGVHVEVVNGKVRVDAAVNMKYGFNIPATSSQVQSRIKQSIENMTGLEVTDVNIRIAGITIPSDAQ